MGRPGGGTGDLPAVLRQVVRALRRHPLGQSARPLAAEAGLHQRRAGRRELGLLSREALERGGVAAGLPHRRLHHDDGRSSQSCR